MCWRDGEDGRRRTHRTRRRTRGRRRPRRGCCARRAGARRMGRRVLCCGWEVLVWRKRRGKEEGDAPLERGDGVVLRAHQHDAPDPRIARARAQELLVCAEQEGGEDARGAFVPVASSTATTSTCAAPTCTGDQPPATTGKRRARARADARGRRAARQSARLLLELAHPALLRVSPPTTTTTTSPTTTAAAAAPSSAAPAEPPAARAVEREPGEAQRGEGERRHGQAQGGEEEPREGGEDV